MYKRGVNMFQIMVVEDNKNSRKLFCTVLMNNGFKVIEAENGLDALDKMEHFDVDLIVLDIMMPKMDGYQFTEELRSVNNTTPILMITAKTLPEERCRGFIVGTDDYMVKPVNEKEMVLRIRALLRRAKIANENKLIIGNVILDYESLTITKNGEKQTLPQKEFLLLFKLLSYPEKIFTRLQLMDEIWGMDSETIDKTVDVHINRLRKRFADCDDFQIIAIRGIGYKAVIKNEKQI